MFSAMGTEPRLCIMQLLLSAHLEGLVVGELQSELDIPNSTLSHHLDKLRNENLVLVSRESTSCATRRIPKPSRKFSNFSTPNVALEIKPSPRAMSSRSANKEGSWLSQTSATPRPN
jgi:DNA-binding transcriptional ArsR family regulator